MSAEPLPRTVNWALESVVGHKRPRWIFQEEADELTLKCLGLDNKRMLAKTSRLPPWGLCRTMNIMSTN